MIKLKNTTESLGLYKEETYESEEEMRSLVSDWLLEGGMEDEGEREQYIDRWMKEVSYENESNNEKMERLGCEPWDESDPEDAGYRECPACGGKIYDHMTDDEPCHECGGEGELQWQVNEKVEDEIFWCEECQHETPRNAGSQCRICGSIN